MNELLRRIIACYNLQPAHFLPPQKGYRNRSYPFQATDGQTYNLILYKNEPNILEKIHAGHQVAAVLAKQNFPVRTQADLRVIRLHDHNQQTYGALYNYLPGQTIPWEGYTKAHLKLLGKTMSDLHAVLSRSKLADLPEVSQEYSATVQRMRRYFETPQVAAALKTKLDILLAPFLWTRLAHLVSLCNTLPHQHGLHMDFVRSNLLFQTNPDGKPLLSGIIDFEKASHGHPMWDIARTLAFLLVDCKYTDSDKVRKYFLVSGYQKRGHASLPQMTHKGTSLFEPLVVLFLTYDFYKFLRHNPYESLTQNDHFVRTRDILVAKGILHWAHTPK